MKAVGWVLLMVALCGAAGVNAAPAPGPTHSVEVEGAAAVVGRDAPAARQAAIKQALRTAVEQTVGVYVSATTRTRNYVVLEDRVYTRAGGFAVVDQVLDERNDAGTYRVTIRATVSVKPLLDQLKAAGLTRQWRVLVSVPSGSGFYYGELRSEARVAEAEVQSRLAGAGFTVVDWRQRQRGGDPWGISRLSRATPDEIARAGRRLGADVLVLGEVTTQITADVPIPLPTDLIHVSFVRCKAQATVRAVRADTAEVIAAETFSESGESTSRTRAVQTARSRIGRRLGDRFTDALLLLPAGMSRSMQVVVSGFERVADARRFEDALATVPGVERVSRQEYTDGRLTLDVDVDSDAADRLAVILEEAGELKEFRPRIESDTKSRVAVRVT